MKHSAPWTTLLLAVVATHAVHAQIIVTGTVIDHVLQAALPGVTVTVEGTDTGTTTGSAGNYTIRIPAPGALLSFSFVGFVTQRITHRPGQTRIDVELIHDVLRLEELVVVGSRRLPRLLKDSAVPVDVLGPQDLARVPTTDMDAMLRMLIPSYTVLSGGDEASLVRPAAIRGLPNDNVLVLINGKRRHRSASIALSGSSLGDGAQGPDLNMIPGIAIKQIELLRDGAAAQYGADAVAGVANFQLRDTPHTTIVRLHGGKYFHGDGEYVDIAANAGLPLPRNGFVNTSLEYRNTAPTVRSQQRTDARFLAGSGYPVANPAQIWGNADIDYSWVGFVNASLDLGNNSMAYAFGGWGQRQSETGFYFRSPGTESARGSVFRFGSGDSAVRAAMDLVPDDGVACQELPALPDLESSFEDVQRFIDTYRDQCFLFNELFPGGFTPRFGADISDLSLVMGTRGMWQDKLHWDFSISGARSLIQYFIHNTINASLGPQTPVSFRPRDYVQEEFAFNLDFSLPVAVSALASPLNIAWGGEWRRETFESVAGNRQSWEAGPYASQGFSVGSNGYQGLNPRFAGRWARPNVAVYADLEADITQALLLNAAVRYENFYSTFGSTMTGKTAVLYRITPMLSLRAAASTGFRAPTPGQSNINVFRTTSFSSARGLIEVGQLPPTHPISMGLGGRELSEERSASIALGAALGLSPNLDLTLDYFDIRFRDRLSVTGNIPLTEEITDIIDQRNILGGVGNLGEVRFYSNDFETRTRGLDLVLAWQAQDTGASAAWNWTATTLEDYARPTRIDHFLGTRLSNPVILSLLTPQRQIEIEDLNPNHRVVLTGHYGWKSLQGLVRANYYDSWSACRFRSSSCADSNGESTLDTFEGAWIIGLEGAVSFMVRYRLAVGVHNLFDTSKPAHADESSRQGNLHPRSTPWDANGAAWYARLSADF